MLRCWLCLLVVINVVLCYPYLFETKKFKVGIEYENHRPLLIKRRDDVVNACSRRIDSLPMKGGSDRYRHRNNFDPFFVTVTARSKSGYVITYLEVTATVDLRGEVDFKVIRGQTGSTSVVFQLVSNSSDFLSYSYMTYGIREEEYRKMANIIVLPPPTNKGTTLQYIGFKITALILSLLYFCTL